MSLGVTEPDRPKKPGVRRKPLGSRAALRVAQCEAVRTYRKRLLSEGRGVPENPKRPGEISWWQVRRETGLPQSQLGTKQFARRQIEALAAEVGLSLFHGVDAISFTQFSEMALHARRRDLSTAPEAQPSNRKKLSNLRWALGRVAKSAAPDASAREAIEGLLTGLGEGNGSLKAELSWCLRLLRTFEAEQDLPDTFHAALRLALVKAGLSRENAARQVGMNVNTLISWINGRGTPRPLSMYLVTRIETLCRLPAGSLTSRVKFTGQGKGALPRGLVLPPEFKPRTFLRRRLIAELPADTMALEPAVRDELLQRLCQRLLDEKAARHHRVSHTLGLPYRLNVWPERLEREWEDLVRFKGEAALALDADRREGKLWQTGTLRLLKTSLGSILGFLTMPTSPCHIDLDDISLAHLVFIGRFANAYLTFRSERNRTARRLKKGYITTAEVGAFWMIRSQVKAETGWLAQRPELAQRLTPVKDFITEADIAIAKQDWAGACTIAHAECRSLIKSYQRHVAPGRDTHDAVLPILTSPNPLAAFHLLNRSMQEAGETIAGGVNAAIHLRDRVLVGIISQFPLRPETISNLDYTLDGRGHLRREGDKWKLRISRFLFKNPYSSYFRVGRSHWKDFEEEIQDLCGLHDALARYVDGARECIMRDRTTGQLVATTDALFVVKPRRDADGQIVRRERDIVRLPGGQLPPAEDPCRMSPTSVDDQVLAVTERHLSGKPDAGTGIPGVRPFAPVAFRHIVATGVFKATDSWSAAADAIQDDVSMVKSTYGRYDSSDRRDQIQNAYVRAYGLK